LLDRGVAAELRPARLAAAADRDRVGRGDCDLPGGEPDQLPAVPAVARRVLRAALRRAARRLAARRAALRRGRHLPWSCLAPRDDRVVARRLLRLRMDRADDRPRFLDALPRGSPP